MRKIADILQAKQDCEKAITAERTKSPSMRDKVKIKNLQEKHRGLTKELSQAHEGDRVTPVDKSDKSEGEHKKKVDDERQKKIKDWEKEQEKKSKSEKTD